MVRQLISKVSRGHMKKLDPVKKVVIERQAFVDNKVNYEPSSAFGGVKGLSRPMNCCFCP